MIPESTYKPLYCNDCCTQPLQYRVNERGKYEIVIFEIRGMGLLGNCKPYLENEFDELITTPFNWKDSYIYVCLRKGNLWGLYKYWWSKENDEDTPLLGCVFDQIEEFKWDNLAEMATKYDFSVRRSSHRFRRINKERI